jgi:hypothetical protein
MTIESTSADDATRRDGSRLSEGLGPRATTPKAEAFAQALRGIADGFDQQRPWFRPDELVMHTLRRAADELERLRDALATESSRNCATEHDCIWQPHCAHAGRCMRPERPFGA